MAQPSPALATVLTEALALPPAERSRLAHELLASLGRPPGLLGWEDPGTIEEIDRRIDEDERDPSQARSWAEIRNEIHARFERR